MSDRTSQSDLNWPVVDNIQSLFVIMEQKTISFSLYMYWSFPSTRWSQGILIFSRIGHPAYLASSLYLDLLMVVNNIIIENVNVKRLLVHLGNGSLLCLHCVPAHMSLSFISAVFCDSCSKYNLIGFVSEWLTEFDKEWQDKYDGGGGAQRWRGQTGIQRHSWRHCLHGETPSSDPISCPCSFSGSSVNL